MALDGTTALPFNASGSTLPEELRLITAKEIRATTSIILKMKKGQQIKVDERGDKTTTPGPYEKKVSAFLKENLDEPKFRLLESLYETLRDIDKTTLIRGAASLVNAIAENKEPTESDDVVILQIQNAIPELIEEDFLPAISSMGTPAAVTTPEPEA